MARNGTRIERVMTEIQSDGVVLAPGNAFSQSLEVGDFLRFNVAQSTDVRMFDVLARALRA